MWPPFFDFSSAAPWVAGGFVAGLLAYALVRAVLGIDRRRVDELAAAKADLAEAQSAASVFAGANASLDAEVARLARHAALSGRHERDVVRFRNLDGQRQSSLDEAAKQLAIARDEVETHRSAAQYYEDEFGRLAAKHDESVKTAYAQLSEMAKRMTDLSDRVGAGMTSNGDEVARLKAQIAADAAAHEVEVAKLKAQIAATPPEGIDPEMYESEVSALLSTVKDLRVQLSASDGAVNQIRAVLNQ